jgi:dihydroxyacetone kinase-like protein
MSSGLISAGKVLKGKENLESEDWISLFRGYMDGVANLGKAKIGEKTFLDGIAPAVAAMEEAVNTGCDMAAVSLKAAQAAKEGVKNTTTMQARHGRAAIRGEASTTLIDPGATVAAFLFEAFAKVYQ